MAPFLTLVLVWLRRFGCSFRRGHPALTRTRRNSVGYAGRKMALTVWRTDAWSLQIVRRSDVAGFEVLPKRWIVERTFAWISRNRRLARDFERYATTVAAFIRLAISRIMLRRLSRSNTRVHSSHLSSFPFPPPYVHLTDRVANFPDLCCVHSFLFPNGADAAF